MRLERWYWLPIFCVVSMLMHVGVAFVSRTAELRTRVPESPSIEVAFEPAIVKPLPKPAPKVVPLPKPKPKLSAAKGPKPAVLARSHPVAVRNVVARETPEPVAPRPNPGIVPLPVVAKPKASPVELPERISSETPVATKSSQPSLTPTPHIRRATANPNVAEGGGSPSPAPVAGGKGGLNAPAAPREDVLYTGGGKGGADLPNLLSKTGSGGGSSILHVKGDNPIGNTIPEDKP